METKYSKEQIREMTACLSGGKTIALFKDLDSQIGNLMDLLIVLGASPSRAEQLAQEMVGTSGLDAAFDVARKAQEELLGSVLTRTRYTVPTGDKNPKGTTRMNDQVQTPEVETEVEAKAPRARKEKGERPARGALNGVYISASTDINWRREGTHGHKTVQLLIDHGKLTLAQLKELGGLGKDVLWDIENNVGKIVLESIAGEAEEA